MANKGDKFWSEMAGRLRRALHLDPLTMQEAEEEYRAAEDKPIPDETIYAIMQSVCSGEETPFPHRDRDLEGTHESNIEDQVLQLNRNQGEEDAEVDELIEKHRRKALEGE